MLNDAQDLRREVFRNHAAGYLVLVPVIPVDVAYGYANKQTSYKFVKNFNE